MSDLRGVLFLSLTALAAGILAGYLIFSERGCAEGSEKAERIVLHTDTIIKPVRIREKILIPEYSERVKVLQDTVFISNESVIQERETAEFTAKADTLIEENGCLFEVSFNSPAPLRKDSFFRLSVNCPPVAVSSYELIREKESSGGSTGLFERIYLGAFIGYGASVNEGTVIYAPAAGLGIGIRILP